MKAFVQQVARVGKVMHLERKELAPNKDGFFNNTAFLNLYAWLRELHPFLQQVDLVLIEQQMKVNAMAQVISHHLHAFLLIHYPQKMIKMYPAKQKTRVIGMALKVANKLGNLSKVTKVARKKWAVENAEQILKARQDHQAWYDYVFKQNKSKKDDLSDVIMQNLSYIITQIIK